MIDSFYAHWESDPDSLGFDFLNDQMKDSLLAREDGVFLPPIFQDSILQILASEAAHPLSRALQDNDVYDWTPQAPTCLYYCWANRPGAVHRQHPRRFGDECQRRCQYPGRGRRPYARPRCVRYSGGNADDPVFRRLQRAPLHQPAGPLGAGGGLSEPDLRASLSGQCSCGQQGAALQSGGRLVARHRLQREMGSSI